MPPVAPTRYVLLPVAAAMTGYTVKAMERKIESGVWAHHPYRKVIGIEYSPHLVNRANENLAQCRNRLKCRDVSFVQCDAGAYEVPDEVTTVFLYNPFRGEIMHRFMTRLHESIERRSRKVTVVFVNPINFDATQHPWLRRRRDFKSFYPYYQDRLMESIVFSAGSI